MLGCTAGWLADCLIRFRIYFNEDCMMGHRPIVGWFGVCFSDLRHDVICDNRLKIGQIESWKQASFPIYEPALMI